MGLLGRNLAGGVQPAGDDAVPLLNEAWQVGCCGVVVGWGMVVVVW